MKDYSKEYQDLLRENPGSAPSENKEFYSDMNKLLQKHEDVKVSQKITQEILGQSKRFLKEEYQKPAAIVRAKKSIPILIPFLAIAATALIGINTYLFMSSNKAETQVAKKLNLPTTNINTSQEQMAITEINFDQLLQNDTLDGEFLNIEEEFALLDIEIALNFTL